MAIEVSLSGDLAIGVGLGLALGLAAGWALWARRLSDLSTLAEDARNRAADMGVRLIALEDQIKRLTSAAELGPQGAEVDPAPPDTPRVATPEADKAETAKIAQLRPEQPGGEPQSPDSPPVSSWEAALAARATAAKSGKGR